MKAIKTRLQKLEAQCKRTEKDTRESSGWLAYRQTLIEYLADYPQIGLLADVQQAFDDLEGRPSPVIDADVFYALEPLWQKHRNEFAPDPRTADHFALIARFKAVGLTDDDLADIYKYARQSREEDKFRIAGKCADCGIDLRGGVPHMWTGRGSYDNHVFVPLCMNCWRPNYGH